MNGIKTLTIDGKPLLDFGVWTNGEKAWNGAERDVTTIAVPGRSGELIIDNKRYKNISASYECLMRRDFRHRFDELRAFLLSKPGYRRIEDQREEEYYREGRIIGGLNVSEVLWTSDAGIFTLSFSFKPQRFLKSGEIPIQMTKSGSIYNPTLFDAMPFLRIYGSGTISINGKGVTVKSHNRAYIDIDCEMQNASYDGENMNQYIELSGEDFPKIESGSASVSISQTIQRVEIKPRWWTI